jgi:hypothetical protein
MPASHKFLTNAYGKKSDTLLCRVYKHSGTITKSPELKDRRVNVVQQDPTVDNTREVPRTLATPDLHICFTANRFLGVKTLYGSNMVQSSTPKYNVYRHMGQSCLCNYKKKTP